MTCPSRHSLFFLVALGLLGSGCRGREGESCVCAGDCNDGLVCTRPQGPITSGCIRGDLTAGVCRPEGTNIGSDNVAPQEPPIDMTKRDLGGGEMMTSTTMDESSTSDPSTSSDSGAVSTGTSASSASAGSSESAGSTGPSGSTGSSGEGSGDSATTGTSGTQSSGSSASTTGSSTASGTSESSTSSLASG